MKKARCRCCSLWFNQAQPWHFACDECLFWIQGSIYQPEIEYQPIDPPDPVTRGFMAIHAKILAVIEKAYGTETTKEKENEDRTKSGNEPDPSRKDNGLAAGRP